MRRACFIIMGISVLALLAGTSGCGWRSPPNALVALTNNPPGPHGGDWLDMGNQELFAEILHTKDQVTVYLYDDTKRPLKGDKDEIKLVLPGLDGDREFVLKAAPSQSHEYVSRDYGLLEALEKEKLADARLTIEAIGKDYMQEFNHEPHGDTSASDTKPK